MTLPQRDVSDGRSGVLMAPLLPVARPRLPSASAILPYIKEIDANRWYTNHGQLCLRFRARLARHWGLERDDVALVGNGTLGLLLALRATDLRPGGVCLLPSWTFVATPAAVMQAGLVPHFIDVDPLTWMPDPEAIARRADLDRVSAIVIVAPFGMPFDTEAWDGLSARIGVPVIVDAAAAFDSLRAGGPLAASRSPMVVSLHATKVFGVGEGGAVISRDRNWMERFHRLVNFGFHGNRAAMLPGINAKLPEYTAAVGLAAFDTWPAKRAKFAALTERYRRGLAGDGGVELMPRFGEDWMTSTMSILWPGDCGDGPARLAAEGIASLAWWGPGCHLQPAYAECARDPLPVTEELGRRTLGLPFWVDMTASQVDAVCEAVRRSSRSATMRPVTEADEQPPGRKRDKPLPVHLAIARAQSAVIK